MSVIYRHVAKAVKKNMNEGFSDKSIMELNGISRSQLDDIQHRLANGSYSRFALAKTCVNDAHPTADQFLQKRWV